jgi:hypothetical protein
MTVIAHFGHWYVSLPVFLGPVALLFGWVLVGDWLEKRKRRHPPGRD